MLLDSNILIAYFEAEPATTSFILANQQQRQPLFVSIVSVTEVLSLRNLTKDEIHRIKDFLDEFVILPLDRRVAETAGELRRSYRLSLPDAMLAATAYLQNIPFITRDKNFSKIKEITIRAI